MYKKSIFVVLSSFILGVIVTMILSNLIAPLQPVTSTTTYVVADANTVKAEGNDHFITRILGLTNEEKPSPYDWISENKIQVEGDKVTINIKNAQWAKFTDTNSMDPVIDKGANAIQIIPTDSSQIHIGDIVSYESEYTDGVIIHRIVEIGYDEDGWYSYLKGDNNPKNDPGRVRFSQIKRVTVAIIY